MRYYFILLSFFVLTSAQAQQPTLPDSKSPSAELLEFLAEFNMQSEHDDKDYDIIQHHALQDLKAKPLQEHNDDH